MPALQMLLASRFFIIAGELADANKLTVEVSSATAHHLPPNVSVII